MEHLYNCRKELAKIGDYPILEFHEDDFFRQLPKEAADGLRGVPLGFDKGQDVKAQEGQGSGAYLGGKFAALIFS